MFAHHLRGVFIELAGERPRLRRIAEPNAWLDRGDDRGRYAGFFHLRKRGLRRPCREVGADAGWRDGTDMEIRQEMVMHVDALHRRRVYLRLRAEWREARSRCADDDLPPAERRAPRRWIGRGATSAKHPPNVF